MLSNYHSKYLSLIKRILKADFVGWVNEKNVNFLRVKVGKNEHFLPFEGGEITEDTYKRLIEELLNNGETQKTI